MEQKELEVLLSTRLAHDPHIYTFSARIYEDLHYFALKRLRSSVGSRGKKIDEKQLYQDLFSHSDYSVFIPHNTHGSLGSASAEFLEQLPRKSNFYFDALFTCITNALYQYKLINFIPADVAAIATLDDQRQPRLPSKKKPPTVCELENISKEEFEGRFFEARANDPVTAAGEDAYTLADDAFYVKRANQINAPYSTGPSTNAYVVFRFLSIATCLTLEEMKLLRKCFIAYTVSAHDHTLIEVLDAINLVVQDIDFRRHCRFVGCEPESLFIPIETHEQYQQALLQIFGDVMNSEKTTIQQNIQRSIFPLKDWVTEIVSLYCSSPENYTNCINDLQKRLKEIQDCPSEILCSVFFEDQAENTITHLELLIHLYCSARFSVLPFKLLIDLDTSSNFEEALRNFSFSSTPHDIQLLLNRGKIPAFTHHGTGAILSMKKFTPLMRMMGILGAIDGEQTFYVPSVNDNLTPYVKLLTTLGYLENNQNQSSHGLILQFPCQNIGYHSFEEICAKIAEHHISLFDSFDDIMPINFSNPITLNSQNVNDTVLYFPDPEGNLQQILLYLKKVNESRIQRGLSAANLFGITITSEQLMQRYGFGHDPVVNLEQLLQLVSQPLQERPHRLAGIGAYLPYLSFHIPDDTQIIFGGDYWDATKSKEQTDILHHQIILGHMLINTGKLARDRVSFIAGNRDINKLRFEQELNVKFINMLLEKVRTMMEAEDIVVFLQELLNLNLNSNTLAENIKALWYRFITEPIVINKTIWATQVGGDFLIYTGMINCIEEELRKKNNCSLYTLKRAIIYQINRVLAFADNDKLDQYLHYTFENTMGAPNAIMNFELEFLVYFNELFNYESFIHYVLPLYKALNELSQFMKSAEVKDKATLFTHGFFGPAALDVASYLKANFFELRDIPLEINNLESVIKFYNIFFYRAVRSEPLSPLWNVLQDIVLPVNKANPRAIPGSIITEYYERLEGSDEAIEAYLCMDKLKVVVLGHLPRIGCCVHRKGNIFFFLMDNGKDGYSAFVMNSQDSIYVYTASSFDTLRQKKIKERIYPIDAKNLPYELQLLGQSFTDKNARDTRWTIDFIDRAQKEITISHNGGAPDFKKEQWILTYKTFEHLEKIFDYGISGSLSRTAPQFYDFFISNNLIPEQVKKDFVKALKHILQLIGSFRGSFDLSFHNQKLVIKLVDYDYKSYQLFCANSQALYEMMSPWTGSISSHREEVENDCTLISYDMDKIALDQRREVIEDILTLCSQGFNFYSKSFEENIRLIESYQSTYNKLTALPVLALPNGKFVNGLVFSIDFSKCNKDDISFYNQLFKDRNICDSRGQIKAIREGQYSLRFTLEQMNNLNFGMRVQRNFR